MEFNLRLSDVADEEVLRAIAAPLVRFNECRAGPSGNRPLVESFSMRRAWSSGVYEAQLPMAGFHAATRGRLFLLRRVARLSEGVFALFHAQGTGTRR